MALDETTGETLFSTSGAGWEDALEFSSGTQEVRVLHTSGAETGWWRIVAGGVNGEANPILAGPFAETARYASPFGAGGTVQVKGTGLTNVHVAAR